MEAEYIALSQSMRELIPIREVVLEMQKLVFGGRKVLECRSHSTIFEYASSANKNETHKLLVSTVYEDNNACRKFATAPKMSPRTKYIAVKYHFFRENVDQLQIRVVRIDSAENATNAFTKQGAAGTSNLSTVAQEDHGLVIPCPYSYILSTYR
jgi:hypothetical protein